ncbi:MAG: ImmA/IrrE family metallo-endopeptidase [Bacillota bacterium]|nr:ImmA/IrrE family metallo-endopeptidase [Bacillota bacterium]
MLQDLLDEYIEQSDILAYYNANISYLRLPKYIDGFVFNYRGIYSIIVNSNLSYYRRKHTIIHELAHIELNHIGQVNKPLYAFQIQQKEDEADEYIRFLKDK